MKKYIDTLKEIQKEFHTAPTPALERVVGEIKNLTGRLIGALDSFTKTEAAEKTLTADRAKATEKLKLRAAASEQEVHGQNEYMIAGMIRDDDERKSKTEAAASKMDRAKAAKQKIDDEMTAEAKAAAAKRPAPKPAQKKK